MKKLLVSAAILAVMSNVVMAEEMRSWSAAAELGGTMTTGNTETSTIKAKIDATHTIIDWKNDYYADVLYSEDEDGKTASRWKLGAKGNYLLDQDSGIFALAEHEQDQFSDYDSITSIAAGYSRRIYHSDTSTLNGDIGPGMKFFDVKNAPSEKTGILHIGLDYENKLSETSTFTQILVSDVAFEDEKSSITRSETAVTANIVGELAMKIAFIVRHDNHPGLDKKEIDTETTITLLYSF
ncbi:MAG: DUF481 domain-containing protein [Gammaproteobacteria bacterium]|nr:DUF481 domain-containing protein [Gammaproteobacteria bacterium]